MRVVEYIITYASWSWSYIYIYASESTKTEVYSVGSYTHQSRASATPGGNVERLNIFIL